MYKLRHHKKCLVTGQMNAPLLSINSLLAESQDAGLFDGASVDCYNRHGCSRVCLTVEFRHCRTPSTPATTDIMGVHDIHQAAKGIVISFASVGPNSVKEAAAARSCFDGCNSVRWVVYL